MKLGLAGDTMLGRSVAARLAEAPAEALFSDEVVAVAREADLFVLNLECAISDRGQPWPDPLKPFFFRAPPVAVRALTHLGVSCVNLANNHALDYGRTALLDTLDHLAGAGIAAVGAGPDESAARAPALLGHTGGAAGSPALGVLGFTDHPPEYAAGPDRPGVAYADLAGGVPRRLTDAVASLRERTPAVLVTPHWGPNMTTGPSRGVRDAAAALRAAGATLVAGTSAHVFHGVADGVLYDLGDFVDDYATDARLRNDRGLLFLVTLDLAGGRAVRVEGVPIALDFCRTRLADRVERAWIARRFRRACAVFGQRVAEEGGRLVVRWDGTAAAEGS
ncbi:CapA family protein [Actinacidiphila sp. bgisy167]|uniref:CapA family protein n=1 Tax=Actinacidiphila sp. bgisy167 TaxID=3413797 RepID=UPI003D72671E